MEFFRLYGKEIVAALVPFIAWVLNVGFKAKARLQYSLPHTWRFIVQEPWLDSTGAQISPTQTVQTGSIYLRNPGRETATNVEVVLNWEPKCVNIWPARHFTAKKDDNGRYSAIFDSLAPGEELGIEIFSINAELPIVLTVRCDQCAAKNIPMFPQEVQSRQRRLTYSVLRWIGAATVIYGVIVLLQFLILRTPLGRGI